MSSGWRLSADRQDARNGRSCSRADSGSPVRNASSSPVVAHVAVLDASLDIDPDVVRVAGAGMLPQGPGLWFVPRAHQLLGQLVQHLSALGVATAGGLGRSEERRVGK